MNPTTPTTRRNFLKGTACAGGFLALAGNAAETQTAESPHFAPPDPAKLAATAGTGAPLPGLSPARWIWYPSTRTLANTMVLFHRSFELPEPPRRATGWILGSSRYVLFANGQRVQFGPAPCDPRYEEMDPVDLTHLFRQGRNSLGAQVLYYGHGDGTWPAGKPGLLCWIEIELADGRKQVIPTDGEWLAHYARAWRPGQFKRWYLRAFQEDFDARLHPLGKR